MIAVPFTTTVTLIRRTASGADAYGNDTFTQTETPISGCVVWPRDGNGSGGNERTNNQDMVIVGYSVLFPPGTPVAPTDQVRYGGVVYEIDGSAGEWHSPFTGTDPGVLVALRRVTG